MSQSRCHWGSINGHLYRLTGVVFKVSPYYGDWKFRGFVDPGIWGLPGSSSGECVEYIFLPTPYG